MAPVASLLRAQDEEPELPDIKALSKELDAEYKNKKNRNAERIVEIYGVYDEVYDKLKSADQKNVIKALRRAWTIKPPPSDKSFLKANAACLTGKGKMGLEVLLYALDHKSLETKDKSNQTEYNSRMEVKTFVIESIGYTKNPKALKPLYKLLWSEDAPIIKAACSACSRFDGLKQKERKPIVEELVKVYAYLDSQAKLAIQDPRKEYLRERLLAVEVQFNESLKKLTPARFESAEDWQRWYNDNKGKSKW